jgi:hypothetical protein
VWLVVVGGPATIKGHREGVRYRKERWLAEIALERLGMEQVAGGLGGAKITWKAQGTARILGCDEEHLWQTMRWLGLSVDAMSQGEAAEWEEAEQIRGEEVLQVIGRGTDDPEEVTLKEGIERLRGGEARGWAWGGVVDASLEWVAEKAARMGRGKTAWLRLAMRGMRRVRAVANRRQQTAMQLWLEYRGTWSTASEGDAAAYPCSCCKRWSEVVFVTGETGGRGDGQELRDRAAVARALQRSKLARPKGAWDGAEVGCKVRIPTDEFHTEDQPGRRRRTRRAAPASVVWTGTVVESSSAAEHLHQAQVHGVACERALRVRFDAQEPYELVAPTEEEARWPQGSERE